MGALLYDEHAFRTILTSLLYHARANPEFRERLRRALTGESEGVAYNSDLPNSRTIGVEAAVAHLVLDR